MCFCMCFLHKVNVVRANQLHIIFFRIFDEVTVYIHLQWIRFMIGTRDSSFMALKFQIIIFSKKVLIPLDGFLSFIQQTLRYLFRHLPTQTGRTDNQAFVIFLQLIPVGTWTHIISVSPCMRYQLDKVMIALFILCQYYQVITTLIRLSLFFIHRATGHIHLTTNDGLKQSGLSFSYFSFTDRYFGLLVFTFHFTGFNSGNTFFLILYFPLRSTIFLIDIISKLLDTEHISMIGYGNSLHPIFHGFIYQSTDAGLTI